jgi:hypothetical protein
MGYYWSFGIKRLTHCPKMLIFNAAKGLICGNHPFDETFFKLWAMLKKRVKGQCAGAASRDRNLSFVLKVLLPDRLMKFFNMTTKGSSTLRRRIVYLCLANQTKAMLPSRIYLLEVTPDPRLSRATYI